MKKIISFLLMTILLMSCMAVSADNEIKIYLNSKKIESDVAPVIVNDRTMVPLRTISENLGAEVLWEGEEKTIYIEYGESMLIFKIGSDIMIKDGTKIPLEAAPFIKDDRTLVPIRAICEALNCIVGWDDASRSVLITTPDYTGPAMPVEPEPGTEEPRTQAPENGSVVEDGAYFEKDAASVIDTAITLINNYREENGIATLEYSNELETVALSHCEDMAANDYLSHTSPSGVTFNQRLDNAGIVYSIAAENISSGFTTAEKVIESWTNSETHKNNILNPDFTKVGLGYYSDNTNGTYWTLLLIAD